MLGYTSRGVGRLASGGSWGRWGVAEFWSREVGDLGGRVVGDLRLLGNPQFQSFARVSNSLPAGFRIGPRVSDSGFVGFRLGSLVVSESFSIGF